MSVVTTITVFVITKTLQYIRYVIYFVYLYILYNITAGFPHWYVLARVRFRIRSLLNIRSDS